jgi:hypothetical protein
MGTTPVKSLWSGPLLIHPEKNNNKTKNKMLSKPSLGLKIKANENHLLKGLLPKSSFGQKNKSNEKYLFLCFLQTLVLKGECPAACFKMTKNSGLSKVSFIKK